MRELLIGVLAHAGAIDMDDIRKWLGENKLRSVGEVLFSLSQLTAVSMHTQAPMQVYNCMMDLA